MVPFRCCKRKDSNETRGRSPIGIGPKEVCPLPPPHQPAPRCDRAEPPATANGARCAGGNAGRKKNEAIGGHTAWSPILSRVCQPLGVRVLRELSNSSIMRWDLGLGGTGSRHQARQASFHSQRRSPCRAVTHLMPGAGRRAGAEREPQARFAHAGHGRELAHVRLRVCVCVLPVSEQVCCRCKRQDRQTPSSKHHCIPNKHPNRPTTNQTKEPAGPSCPVRQLGPREPAKKALKPSLRPSPRSSLDPSASASSKTLACPPSLARAHASAPKTCQPPQKQDNLAIESGCTAPPMKPRKTGPRAVIRRRVQAVAAAAGHHQGKSASSERKTPASRQTDSKQASR